MNNKTVVISGASGGIGIAISKAFYNEGYNIVLLYNKNKKALEDELGFPLMIRNRKGFGLTQAGKYLYIEGKNIIANIKEIENHATCISKNNNKELIKPLEYLALNILK